MRVSSHLPVISAVIVSLSLTTSVRGVNFLDSEDRNWGTGLSFSWSLPTPVEEAWDGWGDEVVDLTLKGPKEIADFEASKATTTKAWDSVGGEGTLLPGTEGANFQKWVRRGKNTVLFGGQLALPFVFTAAANEGTSRLFAAATPWVVERAGRGAAQAAIAPCPAHPASWTDWLPDRLKAATARILAEDETEQLMNRCGGYAQTYSTAICGAAGRLGSSFYNGILSPIGSTVKGWFV